MTQLFTSRVHASVKTSHVSLRAKYPTMYMSYSEICHFVFRYAFKLTYDEAVLGPVEDHDELLETLNDYEENWFIGIENKPGWNEAVLNEKANLFTIGYDADKVSSQNFFIAFPRKCRKNTH